jgi:hypothetical protein
MMTRKTFSNLIRMTNLLLQKIVPMNPSAKKMYPFPLAHLTSYQKSNAPPPTPQQTSPRNLRTKLFHSSQEKRAKKRKGTKSLPQKDDESSSDGSATESIAQVKVTHHHHHHPAP